MRARQVAETGAEAEPVPWSGTGPDRGRGSPPRTAGARARPAHASGSPGRRRRPLAVAIVLVAAALVIGLALLGTDLRARDELRRSDGQVAVTTARLHQVQRQVARSQADLDAASSDRRRVADALAGTRATLGSVQRSLTVAERDRFILGVNAGTLNNCLSGVEQALNRLSVGDSAGAVATLTSVSSSCHAVAAGT